MRKAIAGHKKICQEVNVKPFPVPSQAPPLPEDEGYLCVKCFKFVANDRKTFNKHLKLCLKKRNFNCEKCEVSSSPLVTAGRTGNKKVSSQYLSRIMINRMVSFKLHICIALRKKKN